MSERTPPPASRDAARLGLSRGFAVLAGLTFALIVVGSLVRANDAGLACPDWPLCHGQVVPDIDHKIAYEVGHRFFAGAIGLGLLVLSFAVRRDPVLAARMRWRLIFAWSLLITQAVFGGLTVLLLLAPWTVSVHLVLGNAFCVTLLWISRDLAEGFAPGSTSDDAPLPSSTVRALCGAVAVCLLLQMVLGGMVASHYAGLACTGFPTCDGERIVPTLQGLVGIHVIHRLNGFALLALFGLLAGATRGTGRVGSLAVAGVVGVVLQIGIGASNVLLQLPNTLTAMHTGVAAAIVLVTAMLVRDVVFARRAVRGAVPREPALHSGGLEPGKAGRVGEVG